MSCSVFAFTIRSCSPRVRVASCASFVSDWVFGLVGFTRQPMTAALGTVSCSKLFSHYDTGQRCHAGKITTRAVEASDKPELDRIAGDCEHNGNRLGRSLGRDGGGRAT